MKEKKEREEEEVVTFAPLRTTVVVGWALLLSKVRNSFS